MLKFDKIMPYCATKDKNGKEIYWYYGYNL